MARVLAVEHDLSFLKVVTTCLHLDQHAVRTALDIPRGVELLCEEPVDLILTGLFAPSFAPDAFDKLVAFTEVAPAIPIVVATGHDQAAAFDPARYGVAAIILKPFGARELRTTVARVLAQQQRLASLSSTAEQAWEHYRSAQEHISDSAALLRRVQSPHPPASET